jgi:acetyl esterase/lipase
MPM